jgi:hypothetical protein
MPPNQSGESGFVTPLDKPAKQLAIAQPSAILQKHGSAKLLHDLVHSPRRHGHIIRLGRY